MMRSGFDFLGTGCYFEKTGIKAAGCSFEKPSKNTYILFFPFPCQLEQTGKNLKKETGSIMSPNVRVNNRKNCLRERERDIYIIYTDG